MARARLNIRPRTRESYESQLRLHIIPVLGNTELAKITTGQVRAWNAAMLNAGRPGSQVNYLGRQTFDQMTYLCASDGV